MKTAPTFCQCGECSETTTHKSDCAVHNMPACPNEACDCGVKLGTLIASEALFGFMGWLTCRDKIETFSANHNAAPAADLVAEFCKVNNLPEPRRGWDRVLTQPKS